MTVPTDYPDCCPYIVQYIVQYTPNTGLTLCFTYRKEREVKQKLSSLEKRAVKAERLVKQLRDKFVKLEKRGGGSGGGVWDRFGVVKGLLGGIGGIGGIGGPGQALGGDGSRSASGCELKVRNFPDHHVPRTDWSRCP